MPEDLENEVIGHENATECTFTLEKCRQEAEF
jgi:hypothetical protein